ncbi:hypothetical protein KY290_018739 [Solanum tuberosum]|uniref:Uncharacterized protein n=1 Tax=Solanum tuberosum TaxID=4113 RepID=A0ABQ7VGX4_SOLTU|nr:hypothetical protein KY290_018739 [Solanum tuberosum]
MSGRQCYSLPESVAETFADTGSVFAGCFRTLFGRDGNYSHYLLDKYVMNTENWEPIKRCLVDCNFCEPPTETDSYYKYIFPVTQSSCCQPPTYCGLEFHNATYWTMPKAGPAVAGNDCKIWSNVQSELCFNLFSGVFAGGRNPMDAKNANICLTEASFGWLCFRLFISNMD